MVATALVVVPAVATPPSPEVITTPIGMGHFTNIDTSVKTDVDPGPATKFWKARIKTKRASDFHVLQNTIPTRQDLRLAQPPWPQPGDRQGGNGQRLPGQGSQCRPHVVPAGSGFVDQGHDVHVVRNQGRVDLVTVVVSLVPAGFARRIDEPSPGRCLPSG